MSSSYTGMQRTATDWPEMAKYCGRRRYCGIAAAKDSFSSRDEG
jgi:hypothetical protein